MAMFPNGQALDYDLPDTRNQEIPGPTPAMVILLPFESLSMRVSCTNRFLEFRGGIDCCSVDNALPE